jgi:putative FmdB family regulatory protein
LPLYDYQCRACQKVTEVRHGFKEAFTGTCPDCGASDLARIFNPAPILFKGSGFYVTDSRKPSAAATGDSAPKTDSAPKSDSAPKTDAAPKADSAPKKSESSAA